MTDCVSTKDAARLLGVSVCIAKSLLHARCRSLTGPGRGHPRMWERHKVEALRAERDEGWRRMALLTRSNESPAPAEVFEVLGKIMGDLTFREREIIKLRYGLGDGYAYTLEEVGRKFKVTRERVKQIEAKALRKLQHPVRTRELEGHWGI